MDTPKELLEELCKSIKQLAERPAPQPSSFDSSTAADRIRQRVAFGYQVLGTLTGRVSSSSGNEFDVRVVKSKRESEVIKFRGLPPGADWVELRAGNKVEVLPILEDQDGDGSGGDQSTTSNEAARHEQSDRGRVRPRDFKDADPIGSVVFLRTRRGPLIAFGPRLGPVSSRRTDLDRVT
ncbi:MAG: hypothetical protein ACRDN8_03075 [Thermoleophilaceae bacterium]